MEIAKQVTLVLGNSWISRMKIYEIVKDSVRIYKMV